MLSKSEWSIIGELNRAKSIFAWDRTNAKKKCGYHKLKMVWSFFEFICCYFANQFEFNCPKLYNMCIFSFFEWNGKTLFWSSPSDHRLLYNCLKHFFQFNLQHSTKMKHKSLHEHERNYRYSSLHTHISCMKKLE